MTKHRINARTDANEADMVKALEKIPGVTVSRGHDDILIGHKNRTYWVEVKDPKKTLNKNGTVKSGSIKKSQVYLLKNWKGHYQVCWTLDDVLDEIGIANNPDKLCGICWLSSDDNDPRCVCD